MTTQVASLERTARRLPVRPIASLLVWSGAVWTTGEAVRLIAPELTTIHVYLMAMAIQVIMTLIESDIWAGQFKLLAIVVLLTDILINAGGLWFWLIRIDQAPFWEMFTAAGAPEQLGITPKICLAVAVGTILAYAPEAIWNGRER